MDGENNGTPYEQMDDLGVFPYFRVDTHINDPSLDLGCTWRIIPL